MESLAWRYTKETKGLSATAKRYWRYKNPTADVALFLKGQVDSVLRERAKGMVRQAGYTVK